MISEFGPATPCSPLRAHAADGARLVACAHGGQVLGWTPASDGRDRLWLSPLARCGPGAAIRGGIPVVFPQFAGRGPLPKHGLARDRTWELDHGTEGAPVARVTGRLTDDEQTRAIWPHRFTLTMIAEAVGNLLTISLQARNDAPVGGAAFTLTAALHSYLAVDAASARLEGMSGYRAQDNAAGGAELLLPDAPLAALGPRDLAVPGARWPVRLVDSDGSAVQVSCAPADGPPVGGPDDGFDSLVIWNPGDEHGLPDAPPDAARRFLCVEPARLSPVTVAPQGVWRGTARLEALVPDPDPGRGGA
jgi:glucose-6-phosphate 1-epimerase